MMEIFHIELMQMMENAGRHLGALARRRFLGGEPTGKGILVLAGSGGNGGGGLVAARRLHNWGADVKVYTTRADENFRGVPAHQLNILRQMGVSVSLASAVEALPAADVILDAVIGYSLRGIPLGTAAHLIHLANASRAPILSLDVPSGMDSTTGEAFDPHIEATATLTLALPKTGLVMEDACTVVGELYLADISVPPDLYTALGLKVGSIFSEEEIIRIH